MAVMVLHHGSAAVRTLEGAGAAGAYGSMPSLAARDLACCRRPLASKYSKDSGSSLAMTGSSTTGSAPKAMIQRQPSTGRRNSDTSAAATIPSEYPEYMTP